MDSAQSSASDLLEETGHSPVSYDTPISSSNNFVLDEAFSEFEASPLSRKDLTSRFVQSDSAIIEDPNADSEIMDGKTEKESNKSNNDNVGLLQSPNNSPLLGKSKRRKSKTSNAGASRSSTSKQFKVFRNLLILEQNLRRQYLEQLSIRHKFMVFYFSLIITSIMIFIKLYVPIVDYSSANVIVVDGKSGYFNSILRFVLILEIITIILFHISGEYKKTIVIPKKFLLLTNKSLRSLNLRLLKLPNSYFDIFIMNSIKLILNMCCEVGLFVLENVKPFPFLIRNKKIPNFLFLKSILCFTKVLRLKIELLDLKFINIASNSDEINYQIVNSNASFFRIKLSLNSRVFNNNVRESWELFRNEFWIKEFVRRNTLIDCVKYDSDINAILQMVLNNQVHDKTESASSPIIKSTSNTTNLAKSPARTPIKQRIRGSRSLFSSNASPLQSLSEDAPITPLTSKMLKSFEMSIDSDDNFGHTNLLSSNRGSRSPSPADSNIESASIHSWSELLKRDRDDRRVRRKSQSKG